MTQTALDASADICVVMPCYNAAKTLNTAVASILAQTIPVRQIIIVDNNSTDGSIEIARDLARKNPQLISAIEEPVQGVPPARNRGVEAATSRWIAFLDADDEWYPEKIERSIPYLDGRHVLVCHDFINRCDGVDRRISSHKRSQILPSQFASLLANNFIGTLTVIANREAILRAGGFALGYVNGEDYNLWLKLLGSRDSSAHVIGEPLATRNHRPDSISRNRLVSQLWSVRARCSALTFILTQRYRANGAGSRP